MSVDVAKVIARYGVRAVSGRSADVALSDAAGRLGRIGRDLDRAAGRACFALGCDALGLERASPEDRGHGVRPKWPPGLVGSISHTHGCAGAIVARADQVLGVGIDCQRMISEAQCADLVDLVCTPGERARFRDWDGLTTLAEVCTVLFSIKESIYKAHGDDVQAWLDFHAIEVKELSVLSGGGGEFVASLVRWPHSGREDSLLCTGEIVLAHDLAVATVIRDHTGRWLTARDLAPQRYFILEQEFNGLPDLLRDHGSASLSATGTCAPAGSQ